MEVTFFGHRDAPASVYQDLLAAIANLIEKYMHTLFPEEMENAPKKASLF